MQRPASAAMEVASPDFCVQRGRGSEISYINETEPYSYNVALAGYDYVLDQIVVVYDCRKYNPRKTCGYTATDICASCICV